MKSFIFILRITTLDLYYQKEISIKEYLKDLFDGKENKLSFNEDHTIMNNNYSSVLKYNYDPHIIEDYWMYKEYKVYNCDYSKII